MSGLFLNLISIVLFPHGMLVMSTNMKSMFCRAMSFNQPLNNWDVDECDS